VEPKPTKQTKSRKEQPVKKELQSMALSHLILEAKLRDKQFGDKAGNAIKVQMESLVPDLSKITKAERIKEMVLMHVWLSGIKALLDTNSYV
jgi:hypothetical protein